MTKIGSIKITEHCTLRQWERGINDAILEKVLWAIPFIKKGKNGYIVGEKTQTRLGLSKKNLFVLMKNNIVITVFYIDNLTNFLFNPKKDIRYQVI